MESKEVTLFSPSTSPAKRPLNKALNPELLTEDYSTHQLITV